MDCAVCGITAGEAEAVVAEHEGKDYRFCSVGCKDEFLLDPEQFIREEEHGEAEEG